MRGEISLPRARTLGQRAAWVFAVSALALTLSLGGCRAGGAHNTGGQAIQQNQSGGGVGATGGSASTTGGTTSSTNGSNGTSNGSTGSSNSAALQQLQTIDSQNQNDASQLNQSQGDAGVNYSSQENQTQP